MPSAVRDDLASPDIDYDRGSTELTGLAPRDRSRLFLAQLTVPACGATLGRSAMDHILRGVELLQRVSPSRRDTGPVGRGGADPDAIHAEIVHLPTG